MILRALFAVCWVIICIPTAGLSVEVPTHRSPTPIVNAKTVRSDSPLGAKAAVDTILLMGPAGSGAPYVGDFEAGWNEWTSIDDTQPTVGFWQVSNYNQTVPSNLAAWCGDIGIASCNDSLDVAGGYGNSWHQLLSYRTTVADPSAGATVVVTATLQHDTEPGYDYTRLSAKIQGNLGFTDIQSWDGQGTVAVSNGINYLPSEFVDGTDVYVLFRVQSDGGWSDSDCSWPTAGACQIDDITVTTSQSGRADIVHFTDFQDNTFGPWFQDFPQGVGDFAQRWPNLHDIDPCGTNSSYQVAFIDDGIVVPETGGTRCINWCYGPGGYIVNPNGGLAGPASHIENYVVSPPMLWPDATKDGALFSFDVYVHEGWPATDTYMLYDWQVRSADTDGSGAQGVQTLEEQPWLSSLSIGRGGPQYRRHTDPVGELMNSGRDLVQVRLGAYQPGWVWGGFGDNGTPAPYFDNVRFEVFDTYGPALTAREVDLAQDNFPETDIIDFDNLGSMHVRFDMAANISPANHLRNDPGDSLVLHVAPQRAGAVLVGSPAMYYTIIPNPVFDAYRTTPTTGAVPGKNPNGLVAGDWSFDLPDTGTLFPGDILHYYFRAGDDVGGVVQHNTLPTDLTGYGDSRHGSYDTRFTVHALPTIRPKAAGGYFIPNTLIWNDGMAANKENLWFVGAIFSDVFDFDVYRTQDPAAGVGNGLGGRTSGGALSGYQEMIYTSGEMSQATLSDGSLGSDPGNDLATLNNWLADGNRDIFLSGDNLAFDLAINQGVAGVTFLQQVMGLDFVASDLRPLIDSQATPTVHDLPAPYLTDVFHSSTAWSAYGACPGINTFDAVTPRAGTIQQAEFTDPAGSPDAYPYAAAALNISTGNNRAVSMPYDWSNIYTIPGSKVPAPQATRDLIMLDIRDFFGPNNQGLVDVPPASAFSVTSFPNPFNPTTRIDYTIKAAGHLSLKVYNLRGQLVRTLIDGEVKTGGYVMWDGTDDGGAAVASGVYFREARMGEDIQIGKMALIK